MNTAQLATLLTSLRTQFPLVTFDLVDQRVNPRNEDAFYLLGSPKPEVQVGQFIKMTNPMGGGDTVAAASVSLLDLASWHQSRAEAKGFCGSN